jgi:hypothetical protein
VLESEGMSDQSYTEGPTGKIIGGENSGLGTVTPEMVEERARQLARMDGRTEPHGGDRERAHQELLGVTDTGTAPEEVDQEVENVVAWDQAPEDTGVEGVQVLPEDEANIAETLVREGLEEADHDQRLSAAEANPPEEEER